MPHPDSAGVLATLRQLAASQPASEALLQLLDELEGLHAAATGEQGLRADLLLQVTHELRTPLNGIIGLSELLQQEHFGGLNHRQLTYVENILHSGRSLLDLVDRLLAMAGTEQGGQALRRSWMGVAELVRPCIAEAAALVEADGIRLLVEVPPDLPAIFVDVARCRQVVLALLTWAIARTGAGRTLSLSLQAHDQDVLLQLSSPGGRAPPDREDLTDTERIVALHGGHLAARETDQGPLVSLSLPRHPVTHESAGPNEPTVLLVNPRRIDAHLQASALQQVGVAVISVDDADQARAAARELQPVAVVVDSDDATTMELVAALRRTSLSRAPLVLVSDGSQGLAALRAGVAVHVHRPALPDQLVQGVELCGVRTFRVEGTTVWVPSSPPEAAPLIALLEAAGCEVLRGEMPPSRPPEVIVSDRAGSAQIPLAWSDLPLLLLHPDQGPRPTRARTLALSPAEARRAPQRVIRWIHRVTGSVTSPRLLLPFELRSVLDHQIAAVDRSGADLVLVAARLGQMGPEERPPELPEVLARRLRQDDVVGWIAPDVLAVVPGRVTYAGAQMLKDRFLGALKEARVPVSSTRIVVYPDDGLDADALIGAAGAI